MFQQTFQGTSEFFQFIWGIIAGTALYVVLPLIVVGIIAAVSAAIFTGGAREGKGNE